MKKLIVVLAFAAFVSADAQNKTDIGVIVYSEPSAVVKDGNVVINVGADISNLELKRRQGVTLTPILRADDGTGEEFRFAPVTIAGKGMDKSIHRAIRLGREHDTAVAIKRNNGYVQMLDMEMTLPLEGWMRRAELVLIEEVSGCRKCEPAYAENVVGNDMLPSAFEPVYHPAFETVAAESVKSRSKTYSATISFAEGSYHIVENYKDNRKVLAEVGKVIEDVQSNSYLILTKINIEGYASPEGNDNLNKSLSDKRAASFAGYLENKYGLKPGIIEYHGNGEDWLGLLNAVEASDMKDKVEIIRIMEEKNIADGEAELRGLNGGETYRYMLRELYPSLRRVDYTITYLARALTAAEAAEIIKTNPSVLSLSEMYEAADLSPAGSSEYIAAYETAVRYFPDNSTAANNLAAVRLQSGDADAAIALLKKTDSPVALNNLGIAYFIKGDYTRATYYFSRSAKAGNVDALYNSTQLDRWKTEM